MLAKRTTLNHKLAGEIELPLLVPSFSSKGGPLKPKKKKARNGESHEYSEASYALEYFGQIDSTCMLVSAYDLHFGHFEGAPEQQTRSPYDSLQRSSVVFIDSGGYELISTYDSTEPKIPPYRPKGGFGVEQYLGVLKKIVGQKQHLPLIVANFDYATRHKPLAEQVSAAREIFGEHKDWLSDFIIKPWTKTRTTVDPKYLSPDDFASLRNFDIIGVTEDELGSSMLQRLYAVAGLRVGLDSAGVHVPIHIWGGLDPVITPLYFFAGAQIFDGVSWLRYAYQDGIAVSRKCCPVLERIVGLSDRDGKANTLTNILNVQFLERLASSLRQWIDFEGEDFRMFDPGIAEKLSDAYRLMKSKIPELGAKRNG
jgi:hypothetical protein